MKSATVISDSAVLGQSSLAESQMNAAVKQQQIVFEPVPDKNAVTVDASDMQRPSTGSVAVSAAGLVVKQEVRPVIGSTPTVLPDVTPSLVRLPVTYAAGLLERSAVGGLQLTGHNVNAGVGYVTNTVPLNQSVIQFLQQQQQQQQQAAMQSANVADKLPSVASTELTRNTVSNILAAAAAQKTVLRDDNVNIRMLMNLLNRGENKAPAVGGVQWTPAPAHSANAAPSSQTHSPFIVQNFPTVAAVPQNLSNQLVFSLNHSTSFAGSFAAPAVVSYCTTPAVVSSMLVATPVTTSPQLAHSLTADDQVLNLTLHSSSQRMDINAPASYSVRENASQTSSFSQVEPTAFVASAGEKTPAFCDITAVSVATSTYVEPMAVAAHFASDCQPPPTKTVICMTDSSADAVNQVLVHEHDAHSYGSNMIVQMDVTSSPHPPAKPVQTSTPELPHEIKAAGIISGNLESPSLFLTGNNNPMLAETSSQHQPQNTVEMQGFSSPTVLGMDICNGHLTGLNVSAEPAALNVTSSPTDETSANSMSSNLQQSLAELLDLQQQINAVQSVPVTQSVQPAAVLDSPLTRELPAVPSESMQWASSTASHPETTTAELPAETDVVLASASVGTINLLTAAEVLNSSTYGQETNREVFYSPQPATTYALVIGSAGNSQETSPASWNHQSVQSSYAPLTANENTCKEIKQEQLSGTGDVVLDLLTTMSTAAARPAESQLYSQQSTGEVTSDFFNNSDTTSPPASSSALTGTDSAQSVIYVVNPVGIDNSVAAQEPVTQPITYHIVTANQLPNCNHSPDINIVQYATSPQIPPPAASDIHSPTSSGFRVLAADSITPTSTDPSASGIQFQLAQPMSFGSKSPCCHFELVNCA